MGDGVKCAKFVSMLSKSKSIQAKKRLKLPYLTLLSSSLDCNLPINLSGTSFLTVKAVAFLLPDSPGTH